MLALWVFHKRHYDTCLDKHMYPRTKCGMCGHVDRLRILRISKTVSGSTWANWYFGVYQCPKCLFGITEQAFRDAIICFIEELE